MSRFYANIQGSRGEATRQGTANSGMRGHVRGWHVGCRVTMWIDDLGCDVCRVYLTSGSSGYGEKYLGDFRAEDLDKRIEVKVKRPYKRRKNE